VAEEAGVREVEAAKEIEEAEAAVTNGEEVEMCTQRVQKARKAKPKVGVVITVAVSSNRKAAKTANAKTWKRWRRRVHLLNVHETTG
jgi:RNA polymerase-interacting CarD/CdnL/TRCF family regulator